MTPEEFIQDTVYEALDKRDLSVFNVIFTSSLGENRELSITFYLAEDLDFLLGPKILNYDRLFDREGIEVFRESNTVILSGVALTKLSKILL